MLYPLDQQKCAHPDCPTLVLASDWACPEHWNVLPASLQETIGRGVRYATPRSDASRKARHRAHRFWYSSPREQALMARSG